MSTVLRQNTQYALCVSGGHAHDGEGAALAGADGLKHIQLVLKKRKREAKETLERVRA